MASSSAARPCLRRALQTCRQSSFAPLNPRLSAPVPSSLLQQTSTFSTSSSLCVRKPREPKTSKPRKTRDGNRNRGLSPMRKTGFKEALSVSNEELPQPIDPKDFPKIEVDPDHGLWDFFYSKDSPIQTPQQDAAHGRAWTVEELRRKNWDDLHKLWWVCVKERNRIHTAHRERDRGRYGYGEREGVVRDDVVKLTMRAIKHTLTERYYVWEDAKQLAKHDPTIILDEDRAQYVPAGSYLVDDDTGYGNQIYEDEDEDEATEGEIAEEESADGAETETTETEPAKKGDAPFEADKPSSEYVDPSTLPGSEKPRRDAPRV